MRPPVRLPCRCVHTVADDTRQLLRELLRETAQSVAVVTAVLPQPTPTSASAPMYHGATLSSFSSIALDPHPLVAFSLRVPSRMASALNHHVASSSPSLPSSSSSSSSFATPPAHLVINVLSAAQPHLADRFARPDLHPRPFADPRVQWTWSQDGLPVLSGALGALSCRLVGPSTLLSRLSAPDVRACDDASAAEGDRGVGAGGEVPQTSAGPGLASELFVARVQRVEHVPLPEDCAQDPGLYRLPLLYHQRRYTTVRDHGHAKS